MDYTKKNNKRTRTNSNLINEKPIYNDTSSSAYLKNTPKISLKKIKTPLSFIEINREKSRKINRVNLANSASLDEPDRNSSTYNNKQSISNKMYTINVLTPSGNEKIDISSIFIHISNRVNQDKKIRNSPLSYSNKTVNIFYDSEKTTSIDNKNYSQYSKNINKISLEQKNLNPKNHTKKRIDINLPNPCNKFRLLNTKINNNIGDERILDNIKEMPTMMIRNRIKLNNEENTNNSGSFKNSIIKNDKNFKFKSKKQKINEGKKGFMRSNKIYISKQNTKKINKNILLMSNDSIFKKRVMGIENNKNIVCISLDTKKININTSNSIEICNERNNATLKLKSNNTRNNKSLAFGPEIKKTHEKNRKFEQIIKNRYKKNVKMRLFLTNKNKKIENTKTDNIANNIEEKNYIEQTLIKNKVPQTIKKQEIEIEMKNNKDKLQKNKGMYLNKTSKTKSNKNYNIEDNLTNRTNKYTKEEEKIVDEPGENHEDNDTFDNTAQLYNHSSIINNFQVSNKNNFSSKNIIYNILKPISTRYNLIEKIINYLDYESLNNICLINKNYYNIFKPVIYQKIYQKISKLNKKYAKVYNTKIKKSILNISQLSEMSEMLLQKKYMDFLYENNSKYDIEIKKDLTRTLPENSSFKYGNKNYNKLYHILTAYSNYNKSIGYAQGLNFIAAKCIYVFENEIEVFIFFDAIIQKFDLVSLLGINNNLKVKLKEINVFLKKYTPKINAYLENFCLNYDFFTANWMLTLFSNSMENDFLFYLWDYMIVFGWKFFKCFVVAVIKTYENDILKQSQSKLTFFMKNILRDNKFKENFENIISLSLEYMIKENEFI